jgi:hypothetical protein
MTFINIFIDFIKGLNNQNKKIHLDTLNAKLIEDTFLTPNCPDINKSIPKHFTFVDYN